MHASSKSKAIGSLSGNNPVRSRASKETVVSVRAKGRSSVEEEQRPAELFARTPVFPVNRNEHFRFFFFLETGGQTLSTTFSKVNAESKQSRRSALLEKYLSQIA